MKKINVEWVIGSDATGIQTLFETAKEVRLMATGKVPNEELQLAIERLENPSPIDAGIMFSESEEVGVQCHVVDDFDKFTVLDKLTENISTKFEEGTDVAAISPMGEVIIGIVGAAFTDLKMDLSQFDTNFVPVISSSDKIRLFPEDKVMEIEIFEFQPNPCVDCEEGCEPSEGQPEEGEIVTQEHIDNMIEQRKLIVLELAEAYAEEEAANAKVEYYNRVFTIWDELKGDGVTREDIGEKIKEYEEKLQIVRFNANEIKEAYTEVDDAITEAEKLLTK